MVVEAVGPMLGVLAGPVGQAVVLVAVVVAVVEEQQ
jgi:hypothetical protein